MTKPKVTEPATVKPPGSARKRAANDAEPAAAHPIFGHARVAIVTVSRIKYRGGNQQNQPIREPLESIDPAGFFDVRQLLQSYPDGGRFVLTPVDSRGLLAGAVTYHDLRDENGVLNLTAPMPGNEAGTPPAAPPVPGQGVEAVNLYRDLYKLAEVSRENDMKALSTMMGARSGGGESAPMTAFLQGELNAARAELKEERAKLATLQAEVQTLRMQLLRKSMAESDPMMQLAGAVGERFGLVNPGTFSGGNVMGMMPGANAAPAGAAPAPVDDKIVIPSVDELKGMIAANALPKFVVVQAVKLHQAGALPPGLWEVLEPLAAMMGLV